MDRRTSYRIKFRPDACDRWVAQYRLWWSPFWATHERCVYHGVELSMFAPVWFETAEDAEAWCRVDAQKRGSDRIKRRAARPVINLGRLP